MQSSSWMTSNNSNFSANTSRCWSNGGYRKRKAAESDLDDEPQHKMFLTEEKMIKDLQILSLDFPVNNNTTILRTPQVDEQDEHDKLSEDNNVKTRFEFHKLLKDNLRQGDLQDSLINKLCDFEWKKLSMQIVPYMPIHPAQLNNNNNNITIDDKEEDKSKVSSPLIVNKIKKENDDHLFKRPFVPVPYTVEEPCDNTTRRTPRMKRSYSQSIRSNSNLSVVELKNDTNDYLFNKSQSEYFIVEPTTPVVVESATTNHFNSSLSTNRPSIRITEYFDFPSSSDNDHLKSFDDDIDMQSVLSSYTDDKMDDDDDN